MKNLREKRGVDILPVEEVRHKPDLFSSHNHLYSTLFR